MQHPITAPLPLQTMGSWLFANGMGTSWRTAEEKTENIRIAHEALVSPPACFALKPNSLCRGCQLGDACVQEASYAAGGFSTFSAGFPVLEELFPELEHERGLVIEVLSQLFDPNPQKRLRPQQILSSLLIDELSRM